MFPKVLETWCDTVDLAPQLSTDSMDHYVFTFPPVVFDSADDSSCPMLPALTSYDYRNLSHTSFPPDAIQPTPQLLTPPDPSYGYPVLDPALLAISIPQPQSSLPSKPTPPMPAT
ncbi:hypothetical protein BKA83DRAFT_4126679 [Pisolithus microcarpus]|nr:hypothetical protein BKA83DRAFT_4126679 [Pisolithus microcarpus]